jgi:hypothetical protein
LEQRESDHRRHKSVISPPAFTITTANSIAARHTAGLLSPMRLVSVFRCWSDGEREHDGEILEEEGDTIVFEKTVYTFCFLSCCFFLFNYLF